ncbi:polysaccharide deacetylase family protein [Arthrobacter sp. D5-1]|uniref:polysaccharide deacetylase family protein n=1 Tax=Arthrobacter sp. D5-1 TaxID=1477518 RepID=UPI001A9905A9|nr:polysaccharide deacetylase family protein [Arthrobacter sp. D5-1]QSZ49419.1 hypothetical protein AYX22_14100 [Arthrobacter sp. D5-1]
MTLIWVKIGNARGPKGDPGVAGPPGAAWNKADATTAVGAYTNLPLGVTPVLSGAVATSLGLPVARLGTVTVTPHRADGTRRSYMFETNYVNANSPREVWTTVPDGSGIMQPWEKLWPRPKALIDNGAALAGSTIYTLAEGRWYVSGSIATSVGLPPSGSGQIARNGWLTIKYATGSSDAKHFEWVTDDVNNDYTTELWTAAKRSGDATIKGWRQVYPVKASLPSALDAGLRHQIERDQLRALVKGPISTAGATPVAFVWDDYPATMKAKVIEEVRRIGLKITFAVCSRSLDPGFENIKGVGEVTWSDVNSWVVDGLVEIANHSADHQDAATDEELFDTIVTGLTELRAHVPAANPRMTWVQPSVVYPNFNNGDSPSAYANEKAGQLIAAYHPYYTGLQKLIGSGAIPMSGEPVPGLARVWVDSMTEADRKAAITSLAGTGRGIIISTHANAIDAASRWTLAEMISYLEWLKAEEVAGRIKVMFLSNFAFARP